MAELMQWELDALGTRQEKRITVLYAEQYDLGFPPAPLAEFQDWLAKIIRKIPKDFRDTAVIEISSTDSYYDSHYANIEVTYRRYETDEEWEARKRDVLARFKEYKARQEETERHALAVLKAKYEKEQGTNA